MYLRVRGWTQNKAPFFVCLGQSSRALAKEEEEEKDDDGEDGEEKLGGSI